MINKASIMIGNRDISEERSISVNKEMTLSLLGVTEYLKSLGVSIRQNIEEFRDNVKYIMKKKEITERQARAIEMLNQISVGRDLNAKLFDRLEEVNNGKT